MQKIANYISKGEGLGIKFIILASFVVSLIFSLYLRIAGADLVPLANEVVNQMLPIKIENGVVVSPVNTVRVAHISANEEILPLPLVLDTTIDNLDTTKAEPGIYLTRTAIYALNEHEVRMYPYEGDFEAEQADYSEGIMSALSWTAFVTFFISLLVVFISFFIAALFYSICAQILGLILSKKNSFDTRMRLSVSSFMAVYVFYFALNLIGISSSNLVFFITMIALQGYMIYKLPAEEQNENIELDVAEQTTEVLAKAQPEESKTATKTAKKKAPVKKKTTTKKETVAKKTQVSKKKATTAKKTAAKKKSVAKKTEK